MSEIHFQYKRETGQPEKSGYEAFYEHKWGRTVVEYDLSEFIEHGVMEFYNPDYVRWLEEKVESLQKSKL